MRSISDIWPDSFAWWTRLRHQAGRYRVVRGVLVVGMVVEIERVEPYFAAKGGWRWRRKQGTSLSVVEVIAVVTNKNGVVITADRVKRRS